MRSATLRAAVSTCLPAEARAQARAAAWPCTRGPSCSLPGSLVMMLLLWGPASCCPTAALGHHVPLPGGSRMRLSHGRFLHKNPEDPAEVPGGFLSDLNPVSSGRSRGVERGTSCTPAGGTRFHATPSRCRTRAGRRAGGCGAVEGAEGPGVPAELPPPARTPCA